MRRRLAPTAAVAAVLTALLLAGCTAGQSTSTGEPDVTSGEMAPEAPQSVEGGDAAADADRSVITTGSIAITVDDPIAAAQSAADIADASGGRVDSRNETPGTDTQTPSARLTLRIPADELDGVVADLRELGTVTSVSMDASDVTAQRQDLDARIEALTASVDRLRELLATATSIPDLIAIESELTTRQAELDSLTQQRDALADQVDYSTLDVGLVTESQAPAAAPGDFWSGLAAGWGALVVFGSWLSVAIGVLLPWLLAAAVIVTIIVGIVMLTTRRRRARRADAAASVAAQVPPPADPAPPVITPHDQTPEA
ncbi:DUF4349 domain-containing protein [Agromyces cerinus]|uniref:DUF4349 domain-containing protein n=1 Tax=Agromyces cerinus subsp. cerinus TaxID=232089 RepID=A0A1N6I040_9MICO|nr:DUF4349 domain-containing protein [Agromyces cerinus]SIO25434.1 protein of unknown function [Agromyces cerinus subsp. cerinus]